MPSKANADAAEPEGAGHAPVADPSKRLHRATYARDKRNPGSYLVRVIGPTASKFEGRVVPVTRKDDSESLETLTAPVWAGTDEETGRPVALYHFVQKEREADADDDLPF